MQTSLVRSMARVNHAGEIAAIKIYEGQLWRLKHTESEHLIQEMYNQEKSHLKICQDILIQSKSRPTIMLPIWKVAAFALGAATATLGKEAAMACTEAVETVVGEHYNRYFDN